MIQTDLSHPPTILGLGVLVVVSFFAATAAPLLTYTTTLALFGLLHVLSEMRYVHARFGSHVGRALGVVLACLLLGVVTLRALRLGGLLDGGVALMLELGLVLILTLSVLPVIARIKQVALWPAVLVAVGLVLGILVSPIHTILTLAILHNFTPVGFILEATPRPKRHLTLGILALLFVVLPLLIASGLPTQALESLGLFVPNASILPTGALASHLGAYLPAEFHQKPWAHYAFSAITFAQCLHYIAVIHVFPRLNPQEQRTPTPKIILVISVLLMASLAGLFFWNFTYARSIYGIASAVHAWVEIPILLLAVVGLNLPASATAST